MKNNNLNEWFICTLIGLFLITTGCKKEDKIDILAPIITLDNETGSYMVKVGNTITISPTYQNIENATITWSENGKIISTSKELVYSSNEVGDKYIALIAKNSVGEAYVEIKISVIDKVLPVITYNIPEGGFSILKGEDFLFEPTVSADENATYEWYIDNVKVSESKKYTYKPTTTGEHTIKYIVTNSDGSSEITFKVTVYNPEDLPFSWNFEYDTYYLSSGRTIRIIARNVQNDFNGDYSFTLNDKEVQIGKQKFYIFNQTKEGEYKLVVTMKNSYTTVSKELKVVVCPVEGTYKRGTTTTSNARLNKVYEFLAAPGQFINEGYDAKTMDQAVKYATERLIDGNGGQYLSLGAWGGYVVVGFDHSIENDGGYNIQIKGNSFDGSSEPGIVWVMQDENGNGLPDDTWYELKGSDYETATLDYAVTYYKPNAPKQPVQWSDNLGQTGSIDYLGSYHQQDYYYPNWVNKDSYTLYGTKLVSRTSFNSGIWVNGSFDWGYADNWSTTDMIDNSATTSNHFKISDAVKWDGSPANLQYIDFIKVQTALNVKAGIIGENSTEVLDFKDYNMIK